MDTKTKILESVIKESKNSSISKISTIGVSKAAGTSESNIYKIFKTKENLLAETFLYIDSKAAKYLNIDYSENDLSSHDKMTSLIYKIWRKYFDFFVKNTSYINYYSQFVTDNKLYKDEIRRRRTENYGKFHKLIEHVKNEINNYSGINFDFFFIVAQDTTLSICRRIAAKDLELSEENVLYSFHLIFDSVLNY
ncbi:MAG: TetR/AcrR family transcriptional regulator [Acholeplasmatales bacterium]|nr:TetR/AcrR family transcriptional regulator [Acholeplasmatales bacterium]